MKGEMVFSLSSSGMVMLSAKDLDKLTCNPKALMNLYSSVRMFGVEIRGDVTKSNVIGK